MKIPFALLTVVSLVAFLSSSTAAQSSTQENNSNEVQEWNQWRGPERTGRVASIRWPDDLGEASLKKKWSIEMGPSYSGPLVVGERVFVTESRDRKKQFVHALDRVSGEKIWSVDWNGSVNIPFFAKANGDWIRSTPVWDDGRLYVGGIEDVLVCLDARDGSTIWKIDFDQQFQTGKPTFGFVCSPLIDGDFLYIQAGGGLCKIDKKKGEILWRTLVDGGGMNGSVFSSPVIATLSGQRQLLVQMRETLNGVDPKTGEVFWTQRIRTFRGMNILTPTVYRDQVFLSTYGGTTQMLAIGGPQEQYSVRQVWNTPKQGYMSSPVIVDGHAYLNMKNQTITCFNLETGEICWASPRYGKYASLVTNGKKILALDESGRLILFRANPEQFDLLEVRTISNDSWAHLAVRGDELFVRELDRVTKFEWRDSSVASRPGSLSSSSGSLAGEAGISSRGP